MEVLTRFFEVLEGELKGDMRKFIEDEKIREAVFQKYQEKCSKDVRAVQEGDLHDMVFPSIMTIQHPKMELYG